MVYNGKKELYYRLKMVDQDRTAKYSRVAKINLDKRYPVSLYPNPAKEELFIDGLQQYKTVQVADAHGKVLLRKPIMAGLYSINIGHLKAGTYIVMLQGADDVQSLKFVKL